MDQAAYHLGLRISRHLVYGWYSLTVLQLRTYQMESTGSLTTALWSSRVAAQWRQEVVHVPSFRHGSIPAAFPEVEVSSHAGQ